MRSAKERGSVITLFNLVCREHQSIMARRDYPATTLPFTYTSHDFHSDSTLHKFDMWHVRHKIYSLGSRYNTADHSWRWHGRLPAIRLLLCQTVLEFWLVTVSNRLSKLYPKDGLIARRQAATLDPQVFLISKSIKCPLLILFQEHNMSVNQIHRSKRHEALPLALQRYLHERKASNVIVIATQKKITHSIAMSQPMCHQSASI